MLSKGQKINDRYEIIKTIGEGGMANVYLANDTILDRKVAIKVLRGDLSKDEKFIRRFQREALSVSNLSHPNIVEVYDVGEEDGQYYIVMEYIEGKTLKQLLNKRGALTLPEVIDIMTQLTDGIAHAHESYIIHRDIKPQNIMILDNGTIKITDFGISVATNSTQFTQTNSVMGTVHYLPPEQANGKNATIKSDIYSLGILMYELLTGSVPFKGDNAVEIALKHMKEKIPSIRKQNPLIPQSVENIVLKACAKNPRNRYDSVREMNEDLKEAMNKENEKKYVYPYPENDLEETKVITPPPKPKKTVEKPSEEELKEENEEIIIEDKSKNKIIIGLVITIVVILGLVLAFAFALMGRKVEDVRVPNITNMTVEEAILELEKVGLNYTTKEENSSEIEEGHVISSSPKAGSKLKKGSTVTIVESIGGEYYTLEDFTGKNYIEIKTKLEMYGIDVSVEKKYVENPDEYKGKESEIIDQVPTFNKEEETILEKGDKVILYIPDIVDVYPDMVLEKWTIEDAQAFADEYGLTLDIEEVPSSEAEPGTIIGQGRPAGDTIIEGMTLKVKVAIDESEDSPIGGLLPGGDDNNN